MNQVAGRVVLGVVLLSPLPALCRDLTFEDRVRAQDAIERVYYSHQIGATRPFEEAMPRGVIEKKVARYLERSVAFEQYWKSPVTAEMLLREMTRMEQGSRMPDRLRELYAALGDDPLLIQECLARPILLDRLWRGLLSGDRPDGVQAATPVPAGRSGHTAIWTDSLMIIWGGARPFTFFDDTGRYNPVADVWLRSVTTSPLAARAAHSAVWTGSHMILWGGVGLTEYFNDGASYDPATDSFSAISTYSAPVARASHSAVWTGSVMVVWGGVNTAEYLDTGGRYDPLTDTWASVAIGGASPRAYATAVWTGDRMIVFGGAGSSGLVNTGASYDPTSDGWTSIPPLPGEPRSGHTAVWSGTEMIVWGGQAPNDGHTRVYLDDGGRYDPKTNLWKPITLAGAPKGRSLHVAVWTGSEMVLWGGRNTVVLGTGGRYSPTTDTWLPTSEVGAPGPRYVATAVWTGTSMIVWGGASSDRSYPRVGGRYDPATDTWTPTAP